ncbi:hypothetical protein [Prosthecomicrobium pneumaticum]|uniref:DUF4380 domain-containing protein n=1 Tax=Prosthecomicrobium pneumaticum TaxID=81895 RepID=A0A7W9FQQ6_9HYPH|nr:hypothetical protein [Prosthecomicrobium pneumaticum]MBB5755084.1 hypothetical protein [Prosthecomicrobium pneumaticum]
MGPLGALRAELEAGGEACATLDLGSGATLLVSARGGRVFGPFAGDDDPLGWWPEGEALRRTVLEGGWNLGGERIWLAPEALFNFTDPHRIVETYRVDPALDPARWRLERQGAALRLSLDARIALASGAATVGVRIERTIAPLAALPADAGVATAGYRQTVAVRQTAGPALPLVPWIIRQVAPGGVALLAASGPGVGMRIFGDPPETALARRAGLRRVDLSGPGFYKAAYHRDAIGRGTIGYVRAGGPSGDAVLYGPVQREASAYPEALPLDPAAVGQAASLFYDSGRFGAYGELELYGHRDPDGAGRLTVDCLRLRGDAAALEGTIARLAG